METSEPDCFLDLEPYHEGLITPDSLTHPPTHLTHSCNLNRSLVGDKPGPRRQLVVSPFLGTETLTSAAPLRAIFPVSFIWMFLLCPLLNILSIFMPLFQPSVIVIVFCHRRSGPSSFQTRNPSHPQTLSRALSILGQRG